MAHFLQFGCVIFLHEYRYAFGGNGATAKRPDRSRIPQRNVCRADINLTKHNPPLLNSLCRARNLESSTLDQRPVAVNY